VCKGLLYSLSKVVIQIKTYYSKLYYYPPSPFVNNNKGIYGIKRPL
jgi:hypothetical protein